MKYSISQIERKYVFEEGRDFQSCHASTLIKLDSSRVLTACFGGTAESNDDVNIWVAASDADGNFLPPVCISSDMNVAHWNPVLFRGGNGTYDDEIILFFKVSKTIAMWTTVYCISADNGKTWSKPRELVDGDESGGRGPVKNKPIRISDGSWIAPRSVETPSTWTVQLDHSVDKGKSWELLAPIGYVDNPAIRNGLASIKTNGVIQPSLWEYPQGNVHMLMLSTWGRIYRADSKDYGKTWSDAYETDFPNNNSGLDLVLAKSDCIALCLNPVGSNWGVRYPLVIELSEDNGKTFYNTLTLESEKGEFSYPAIIADGDYLYVTYTWNRKNVVYTKLKLERDCF